MLTLLNPFAHEAPKIGPINYDQDSTIVKYRQLVNSTLTTLFGQGTSAVAISDAAKIVLNDENDTSIGYTYYEHPKCHWFFFPDTQPTMITSFAITYNYANGRNRGNMASCVLQASNDTTNGSDGTWHTGTWNNVMPVLHASVEANTRDITFPIWNIKCLRIGTTGIAWDLSDRIHTIKLTGTSYEPPSLDYGDYYWQYRFIFNNVQGGVAHPNLSFSELELIPTTGGADIVNSAQLTDSGDSWGGYVVSNLVDNNPASIWNLNWTPGTSYLNANFFSSQRLTEYTIQARSSFLDDTPTEWELWGMYGQDNPWELIETYTTPADWTPSEIRTFIAVAQTPSFIVGYSDAEVGLSATSITLAKPVGTVEADILVFVCLTRNKYQDVNGPEGGGWTLIKGVDIGLLDINEPWNQTYNEQGSIWWRPAGPTEPDTYSLGLVDQGDDYAAASLLTIRGVTGGAVHDVAISDTDTVGPINTADDGMVIGVFMSAYEPGKVFTNTDSNHVIHSVLDTAGELKLMTTSKAILTGGTEGPVTASGSMADHQLSALISFSPA